MARKTKTVTPGASTNLTPPALPDHYDGSMETTGKYLVLFREDAVDSAKAMIKDIAGLTHLAMVADFDSDDEFDAEAASNAPGILFPEIGVAVLSGDPTQIGSLSIAAEGDGDRGILAVEPERIVHVMMEPGWVGAMSDPEPSTPSLTYLRGYRDAINHIYEQLATGGGAGAVAADPAVAAAFLDDAISTWGLKATRVVTSRFSGRGIRVAVLDTGFDSTHPDFVGRSVTMKSFVAGEPPQDGHGHGTHCIGTSCGPLRSTFGRRYGIAHRASIFAGKVLSNGGSGSDSGILAGIEWALTNRCQVVSMSLGASVGVGQPFSVVFESVARRCLQAGTIIIAAAGNTSRGANGRRLNPPNPVSHPANCPSIMAVAAVDSQLGIAPFSDGGINPNGGGVDIAGPGVDVYSSWPMPTRSRTISGTSMATPHVAGIAALLSEARGLTGNTLAQALTGTALRLNLPSRDVGAGLAQAPQ